MYTFDHWITTPEQAQTLADYLKEEPYASLDTETTTVPWYHPDFKLLVVAITIGEGHSFVIPVDHAEAPDNSKALLSVIFQNFPADGKGGFWVMQNGAFDLLVMRQYGVDLTPDTWTDTLGMQYLLDVEAKKGLEALAQRWLSEAPWKDIDYKHPEEESLDVLGELCAHDADITYRLREPMRMALLAQPELWNLNHKLLAPAMRVLADMEWRGVPIVLDRLLDRAAESEVVVEDLLYDIRDIAGEPELNPNSVIQLRKVLYGKLGLPVMGFTEKGAPSTNAATLQKIQSMHAIIPLVQKLRSERKLLTASLRPWIDHASYDGNLHPRYKPAFVKTGRLSSEMPNIQQVPKDAGVRSIFGGVEGYQVVELDYSQLELRIVAWLANEEAMLAAFNADKDLHQVTADALGVDRQTGKTANFGLLYGAGYRKLKEIAALEYGLEISESQAEAIRAQWFATYPAIAKFHGSTILEARANGGITTVLGRWRPLPDILSREWKYKGGSERQAVNSPIQSVASDITLFKLTKLPALLLAARSKALPFITVHDSILLLVPDDEPEIANLVQRYMEDMTDINEAFGVTIGVPLKVDVRVGPTWGETK